MVVNVCIDNDEHIIFITITSGDIPQLIFRFNCYLFKLRIFFLKTLLRKLDNISTALIKKISISQSSLSKDPMKILSKMNLPAGMTIRMYI